MSKFAMHLALPNERKLNVIDESGQESYKSVDDSRSLEIFRLQNEPPTANAPEDVAAVEEDQPDPRAVLQCLETAKGDLDVVRDLINNIKDQKYMSVQMMEITSNEARLRQMVPELVLKLGRKQQALRLTSQRLRQGAAALRDLQQREDAYFTDLAKLQRYWKVQHSSLHAECPFLVDLALNKDMAEQLPRGLTVVELFKDAACRLRVQLPKGVTVQSLLQQQQQAAQPTEMSVVGVGAVEVHRLLKERQQKLLARLLDQQLQRVMPMAGATAFLATLSRPAVLATEHDSADVRAMQVLVRDFCHHTYWRPALARGGGLLTTGLQGPPAALNVRVAEGTRTLLQDLSFWQSHAAFRRYVRHHLELQALQLGARLHWTPCWHKLNSAVRVELATGHELTVLVLRDSQVEVEGVAGPPDASGPAHMQQRLRAARDIGRAEVPNLLHSAMQALH